MENLFEQLTAKNSEYVHTVTKQLMLLGKSDEEVKTILGEILPQIIEGQKKGILARKLLGAPVEFAESYKAESSQSSQVAKKNETGFLMWLDGSLLFFGVISAVTAIMSFFQSKNSGYGLLTALSSAALAGLVMTLIYKYFYSTQKKQKSWRAFLLVGLAMLMWAGTSVVVAFLPASINIVPTPLLALLMGAVSLGLRFFLKAKFNIQSSLARPRQ